MCLYSRKMLFNFIPNKASEKLEYLIFNIIINYKKQKLFSTLLYLPIEI